MYMSIVRGKRVRVRTYGEQFRLRQIHDASEWANIYQDSCIVTLNADS